MSIYPPDDPFLINRVILGVPVMVRWYGVIIMSGALLAALLTARRAVRRGYDPDDVWNLLLFGLVISIACARAYYVFFEWERFAGQPLLTIINPATGGLAIHGGLIGACIATALYTAWRKLNLFDWLDLCAPAFLLAQAVGRWGNFMNQEAYGRPTTLPFGVRIDPQYRLAPYDDMARFPADTLFHATFLYESLWNLLGALLLFGAAWWLRAHLRRGDIFLCYLVYYSLGRFFIEGLRTDSLVADGLRAAQVVSLLLIGVAGITLVWRHRRGSHAAPFEASAGSVAYRSSNTMASM
jgi:phosphatidylglycerol---prolipoprotein diacylglyceryl transferase